MNTSAQWTDVEQPNPTQKPAGGTQWVDYDPAIHPAIGANQPNEQNLATGQGMEHPNAPVDTSIIQPVSKTAGLGAGAVQLPPANDQQVDTTPDRGANYGPTTSANPIPEGVAQTQAKRGLIGAGAMAAPALMPEAGLMGSAALSAAGAGGGTIAGQTISGQNPTDVGNMEDTATNAAIAGGLSLVGGGLARIPYGRIASRIFRGPGGDAPVTVNPATIATRELESRVPKNPNEEEQVGQLEKKVTEAEQSRQNELADQEKIRNIDAQSRMDRSAAVDRDNQRIRTEALQAGSTAPGPWKPGRGPINGGLMDELAPTPKIETDPFARPQPSGPGTPRVGNEGRAATWTNQRVMELARQGDREAIAQLSLRGLPQPENVRYVAGDARYAPSTYNPRDVTKFDNEGRPIPIRQGGKKLTRVLEKSGRQAT
jgi:hypothetical protein